jgi:hypothetical protein
MNFELFKPVANNKESIAAGSQLKQAAKGPLSIY